MVQYTSISFLSCSIWFRLTVGLYKCFSPCDKDWTTEQQWPIFQLDPGSQGPQLDTRIFWGTSKNTSSPSNHWYRDTQSNHLPPVIEFWHPSAMASHRMRTRGSGPCTARCGYWASTALPGKIQLGKRKAENFWKVSVRDRSKSAFEVGWG